MKDTHDETPDAEHYLLVPRDSPIDRPRLKRDLPKWVEWLRRGDDLHVHLADLLEAHFTSKLGRPKGATDQKISTTNLAWEIECRIDDLMDSSMGRRAAHDQAIKETADKYWPGQEGRCERLRKRLTRKRLTHAKARDI